MARYTCCDPGGVTFCLGCADDVKAGRPLPTVASPEVVEAVKAHALKHYETGGWDVVVECYDDQMIVDYLAEAGVDTAEKAIAAFKSLADIWADRQADARNSAF